MTKGTGNAIASCIIQIILLSWLLFWGFLAFVGPFNKYYDPTLIDCDTDGEIAAVVGMFCIWLTAVFIGGMSVGNGMFGRFFQKLWVANGVCIIFSIASLYRFVALLQYNESIKDFCRW
ncbi:MAG: hypothetical protein SW833_05245 [Cyanobacteriota bacterium]|nr:hypothetical protein [Cyanobacteriota bacterium]